MSPKKKTSGRPAKPKSARSAAKRLAPQAKWGTTETRDAKRVYIVKPNDTLESIAAELYGDPSRSWLLRGQNQADFTDAELKQLTPGQVLRAPPRTFGSRFPMRRIPVPAWADDTARGQVKWDGMSPPEVESLQQRRQELLALVDAEVERYISDNTLAGDDSFPDRNRLTGAFYIGHERYAKERDLWFRVSIFCRCLEHPRPGDDQPGDYLGLEVYLRCEPGGACSVLDTDESSI